MKPLNKRTPMTDAIQKYLEKVSKEKAIPAHLWESLKRAAEQTKHEAGEK